MIDSIKKLLLYIVSYAIIATVLMGGVYLLPTEPMQRHVKHSAKMYEIEGDYPQWARGITCTRLDNFTDAVMLRLAMCPIDQEHVFRESLLNPTISMKGEKSPTKILTEFFSRNNVEIMDNVSKTKKGEFFCDRYSRYWHGYLLVLKPLLLLFSPASLRMINFILQFFLLIYIVVLMTRSIHIEYIYAFLIAICFMNPITTALSFQNATLYYITLFSIIYILRKGIPKNDSEYLVLFGIIGASTSFFDFLSFPMVPLGFCMVLCCLLEKAPENLIARVFKGALGWGIGYAGMWSSKWIIADIFTNAHIIQNAYKKALSWSFVSNEGGYVDTVCRNLKSFWTPSLVVFALLIGLYFVFRFYRNKMNQIPLLLNRKLINALLIISVFPFVWFALLKGHSFHHAGLCPFRNIAVTIFSFLCIVLSAFSPPQIQKKDNSLINFPNTNHQAKS